jgi:23S rRNA (adenine2503-C2)-methyltransferase
MQPPSANILTLTYRYVMLRDVNDSVTEARELVKLLKELPAHVNLM